MNNQITAPVQTGDKAQMAEALVVNVPFAELRISDLNGRRQIDEDGIIRLADNIREFGLIHNLAGYRDSDGKIGIVAGGRRLRALAQLQDDKRFHSVRVNVTEDTAVAKAWAASENFLREAPHPADEIREYGRMEQNGVSVPSIALAFGASEAHVLRRLKLAGLPQPVLEALGADVITLGMAACFTICDDETHAVAILDRLRDAPVSEHTLRRLLKPESVKGTDRRALFVGEKAYTDVGGRLTRDLFAQETLFDDPAILDEVFAAKLAEAAKDLKDTEGWKWVETCDEPYIGWHQIEAMKASRVYPEPCTLSETEAARYDCLADIAEAEGLDEKDEAELARLQQKLDGTYSDVQKALSGALIYVDHGGTPSICAGLITNSDRSAAEAAGVLAPSRQPKSDATDKPPFSAKLQQDLDRIACAARQSALLDHPDLLLDLLAFQLSGRIGYRSVFGLREEDVPNCPEQTEGFAPDTRLVVPKSTPKDLIGSDIARAFRAFRKKGRDHMRSELVRHLAALIDVCDEKLGALIDKEAGTDLRAIWTPTAEGLFKRLTGDVLEKVYCDLLGLDVAHPSAATFARLKKGEKAARLEKLFRDPDYRNACGLTNKQANRIEAWTPGQIT